MKPLAELAAGIAVGHTLDIQVSDWASPRGFRVTRIGGKKSPEIDLVGDRGAVRTLVGSGVEIWLRSRTARGPKHRRVTRIVGHYDRVETDRLPVWPRVGAICEIDRRLPLAATKLPAEAGLGPSETDRYRRALGQIVDMLAGRKATGSLFDGPPEQVVADVGHALLVR